MDTQTIKNQEGASRYSPLCGNRHADALARRNRELAPARIAAGAARRQISYVDHVIVDAIRFQLSCPAYTWLERCHFVHGVRLATSCPVLRKLADCVWQHCWRQFEAEQDK